MRKSNNGINIEDQKYIDKLLEGDEIEFEGQKYHSYSHKGEIVWSDKNNTKVGTSLEIFLTSHYINSKKQAALK